MLVQSSRLVQTVQLFTLFYTGMIPWALGFKGCAKSSCFVLVSNVFLNCFSCKSLANRVGSRSFGLRMIPNDRARSGQGSRPIFGPKKQRKQKQETRKFRQNKSNVYFFFRPDIGWGPCPDLARSFGIILSPRSRNPTMFVTDFHEIISKVSQFVFCF